MTVGALEFRRNLVRVATWPVLLSTTRDPQMSILIVLGPSMILLARHWPLSSRLFACLARSVSAKDPTSIGTPGIVNDIAQLVFRLSSISRRHRHERIPIFKQPTKLRFAQLGLVANRENTQNGVAAMPVLHG